ncbi:OLC1v1005525C1 [Oldenlandia corymbosa var. corymbosa]|uniref:Nuclear transcription factor Y subunit n=1 Tax=Oldenlandia corymbosa var. corymbosa TaxID=529605 RepID=A0AAV1DF22_OLDCO|nr:OLC1v1005525C1 [Oldenlandia corymbosa var. corymbosa]
MHPKLNKSAATEANQKKALDSSVCPDPWWDSVGFSPAMVRGRGSDSSSLEKSMDDQSQSDSRTNDEDDDMSKQSQSAVNQNTDGNYTPGEDGFHGTIVPPQSTQFFSPSTQFELVGHSIACAPSPYFVDAFGNEFVHPALVGMQHVRMPLPLEMAQEPVFVNAKQYHGIMRRRQSRAKAELEKKLIKVRKPYLHESRHQHALRRVRGSGGRFMKKGTPAGLDSGSSDGQNSSEGPACDFPNGGEGCASDRQFGSIPSNLSISSSSAPNHCPQNDSNAEIVPDGGEGLSIP